MSWSDVLFGIVVFVAASVGGLAVAGVVLVQLPANYFCDSRPRGLWVARHPLIRWTGLIFKNLLGGVAVALGVILSVPGVPGPGILTILMGVMLLDFPGKRRLERWLLSRPRVLVVINRLRRRYRKLPLHLDQTSQDSRGVVAAGGNGVRDEETRGNAVEADIPIEVARPCHSNLDSPMKRGLARNSPSTSRATLV